MNLLLDTHVIIWSAADPEKVPQEVVQELENGSNELWFSPMSAWEILLLVEKGRLAVEGDPEKAVRGLFQKLPLREAVINQEVAIRSRSVDLPHQDPVDRFLAATAMVYGLTLVTADTRLLNATAFSVLAIH